MSLSSRPLRLAAAVLALVGLLARPAQAVALCPMETARVSDSTLDGEHAHHAEHAMPAEAGAVGQGDAERTSDAPGHEICPDLAHCAVAAPASGTVLSTSARRVSAERVFTAQDRPTSAVASLEPPPPKRS